MTEPVRRALVTGGAVRIGSELCRALGRWGYDVAVHCNRSTIDAENLAAELVRSGSRAMVFEADLSDSEDARELVFRVNENLGALSLLINNAATFEEDRLSSLTAESWSNNIGVNLSAPVLLAQSFVQQLPADSDGLIVNMVDQRVLRPSANYLSYSISKAGLWAATQILAIDLAPRIRVNAIAPGMVMPAPGFSRDRFDRLVANTPLRRATEVEEIVGALRLILDSASMTGQMITLDSGQSLGRAAAP